LNLDFQEDMIRPIWSNDEFMTADLMQGGSAVTIAVIGTLVFVHLFGSSFEHRAEFTIMLITIHFGLTTRAK